MLHQLSAAAVQLSLLLSCISLLHPLTTRLSLPLYPSDLSGNALEGRLPARWARLDDLERLNLNSNSLTGPLPPTWNTLEGLKYL